MFFFFKDFICLFLERGEGREKERERNINVCLPLAHHSPTRNSACNPGMCPYWELNQQPSSSQAGTQSTEPHQPGLNLLICMLLWNFLDQVSSELFSEVASGRLQEEAAPPDLKFYFKKCQTNIYLELPSLPSFDDVLRQ